MDCAHDDAVRIRWTITKTIWHENLIRFARERHPDWRYVADVGCGWTGLLKRAFQQKWPVGSAPILGIGTDIDERSLAKSREAVLGTRLPLLYLNASIEDMAVLVLQGCEFDVMFCWEVLYLLDDEQLDRAVASMRSLLAKDGLLAISTMCRRGDPDDIMDAFIPSIQKKIAPCIGHWRQEAEYIRMFEKYGFSVEVERIRVTPEEYATSFVEQPLDLFWLPDEASRRAYYLDYGHAAWLCALK